MSEEASRWAAARMGQNRGSLCGEQTCSTPLKWPFRVLWRPTWWHCRRNVGPLARCGERVFSSSPCSLFFHLKMTCEGGPCDSFTAARRPGYRLEMGLFRAVHCGGNAALRLHRAAHLSPRRLPQAPRQLTAEQSGTGGGGGGGPYLPSGQPHFPAPCSPPSGLHRFPLLFKTNGRGCGVSSGFHFPHCNALPDTPPFFPHLKSLQCFSANTLWHADASASY